ncbi:MAG: ankyrin repeat domain-containing protein [Pirellulaceae bacterium]
MSDPTKSKFNYSLSDLGIANLPQQRRKIAALLKSGADINETDKNGVTPLHHAVRFRSLAAVQALLEHGARVNQACKRSGSTPLHRAVTSTGAPGTAGKKEEAIQIIDILLKFGANGAIQNKNGKTPADYVRDEDILRLLKKGVGKGGSR